MATALTRSLFYMLWGNKEIDLIVDKFVAVDNFRLSGAGLSNV